MPTAAASSFIPSERRASLSIVVPATYVVSASVVIAESITSGASLATTADLEAPEQGRWTQRRPGHRGRSGRCHDDRAGLGRDRCVPLPPVRHRADPQPHAHLRNPHRLRRRGLSRVVPARRSARCRPRHRRGRRSRPCRTRVPATPRHPATAGQPARLRRPLRPLRSPYPARPPAPGRARSRGCPEHDRRRRCRGASTRLLRDRASPRRGLEIAAEHGQPGSEPGSACRSPTRARRSELSLPNLARGEPLPPRTKRSSATSPGKRASPSTASA